MKELPGFHKDFTQFVREESRKEADLILGDKDPPLKDFDMNSLKDFTYLDVLQKLEKNVPILMASIAGTISDSKSGDLEALSRYGFGGRNRGDSVSLVPTMVQTASAILRNRHPNCVSSVAIVNSLHNLTEHVTSRYFFWSNALGSSFRYY